MDPISAMVSGQPPFAVAGIDGSSTGPMDCPSPPRGRPGDGPLDGLCESWEEGEEGTVISADAFAVAPAGTASMQTFRQTYEGLAGGAGIQGEMPEAARVGELITPVAGGDLSASAPAVASSSSSGLAQAHATALNGQQAAEDTTALSAEAPRPASSTPPPVPAKPASVTTAFLVTEISSADADPLALYDGANAAAAVDGGTPGTLSSQDLLLEWLRREAGHGDEEAQFHLAQLFSPPRFEMKPECRDCGELFGVTRYRHHCRHCGGSFCHEHAWHEHPIPKLGLPAAQVDTGGMTNASSIT